jgi:hypothetical protein
MDEMERILVQLFLSGKLYFPPEVKAFKLCHVHQKLAKNFENDSFGIDSTRSVSRAIQSTVGSKVKLSLYRNDKFNDTLSQITKYENGIDEFSRGYQKMGFNVFADHILYREWAPNAKSASLIGEFSI